MNRVHWFLPSIIAFVILTSSAVGQVFVASPTADEGEVTPGSGQALYGTFGLDAANNPLRSYNIYRKLDGVDRGDTSPEIHTFTPLPDNNSAAIWEGVDHGGSGTSGGFHDPGMFIGNSPSPSTYPDQLIYFGTNRNGTTVDDPDGGVGGNNLPDGTTEPDSNDRVNWEVSVGFVENVEDFVDGRAPHSGDWDLWSSSWNTDGVQMRLFFTASDSPELESGSTDWFSFIEPVGGDEVAGARLVSGESDLPENQRTTYPAVRRYVGSGTEIEEDNGDFLAGGSGFGWASHIGVGYDDEMELSWRMELNDPENGNPINAREVRFTVKTGNLEYSSVFDPGAPDAGVEPNENADEEFTNGYFDWENATPVFYLGLDNGTDYGEEGASGAMGIFIPGDFNADGIVDAADEAIITANLGETDTSYSRGDIDQDGDTDMDDLTAFQSGGNDLATRIDAITDLNARIDFVRDVANTWMGDSNLDGEFNTADFVQVFQNGEYEDTTDGNSTWVDGDWNGDGDFNSTDLVVAFQDGGFEMGPRPAGGAVPEPSAGVLLSLGALLILQRGRCGRHANQDN